VTPTDCFCTRIIASPSHPPQSARTDGSGTTRALGIVSRPRRRDLLVACAAAGNVRFADCGSRNAPHSADSTRSPTAEHAVRSAEPSASSTPAENLCAEPITAPEEIGELDAEAGTVAWKRVLRGEVEGVTHVGGDRLIFDGVGTLTALKRATGKVVWERPITNSRTHSGRLVSDGLVVVI